VTTRAGQGRFSFLPPKRNSNVEAQDQAWIVTYIKTVAPDLIVFHPANGGWRSKAEAARFKWLWVLPGIPDLCVVGPDGIVRFIEVKSETGSLSEAQGAMRDRLVAMRVPFAVAKGIDDVRRAFATWGISTRESR
jgi:hypothetical protein